MTEEHNLPLIHSRGQCVLAGKKQSPIKGFDLRSEAFLSPDSRKGRGVKTFPTMQRWTYGYLLFLQRANKVVKTEAEMEPSQGLI